MSDVSVIGLGEMGSALARAFLAGEKTVIAWSRNPARAAPLQAMGAIGAATVADAIAASPVTMICLSDYAAMRLVPARLMPRAMSIILTGVSIATVCAAPVGAYIGDRWGWRAAFVIAAAVGLVALVTQMITIPKLPPVADSSFRTFRSGETVAYQDRPFVSFAGRFRALRRLHLCASLP